MLLRDRWLDVERRYEIEIVEEKLKGNIRNKMWKARFKKYRQYGHVVIGCFYNYDYECHYIYIKHGFVAFLRSSQPIFWHPIVTKKTRYVVTKKKNNKHITNKRTKISKMESLWTQIYIIGYFNQLFM